MAEDLAHNGEGTKNDELPMDKQFSELVPSEHLLLVCCNPKQTCQALAHELRRNGRRFQMCGKSRENGLWPFIFGSSPWLPERSPAFFILRTVLAAIFVIHWLVDIIRNFSAGFWLIYLTHWSYTVETLYFCFSAYTTYAAYTLLKYSSPEKSTDEMEVITLPWFVKVTWVLVHLAMPASLIVCILYWTLDNPVWALKEAPSYLNLFKHLFNFLLCIFDLCVGRNVFYLRHAGIFFIYVVAYVVWTGIHFASKVGTADPCTSYDTNECPIYTVLDWHRPTSSIILILIIFFVVVPCCHCPLWWCVLKRRLMDIYLKNRKEVAPQLQTHNGKAEDVDDTIVQV